MCIWVILIVSHKRKEGIIMDNEEDIENLDGQGSETQDLTLLDYILILASIINTGGEDEQGENQGASMLSQTLLFLCSTVHLLINNVDMTEENAELSIDAAQATGEICKKLLQDKHVYHDLLYSMLLTSQMESDPPTDNISLKLSTERSVHGVLHNLAVKLLGDVSDLLKLLATRDSNLVNSKLGPLFESLNCTLGSLNRVLDPLPGGEHAMEAELYNVHLTYHKSPIVQSRISEPVVSYCCCSYKQLTPQ